MIPGMGVALRDGSSSQSTGCAESNPDSVWEAAECLAVRGPSAIAEKAETPDSPTFLTAAVAYMIASGERVHMGKLANSTIERLTLHSK